jgi:hypothetical protein
MTASIHFPMAFAKISRHGERFWLKDVKLENDAWSGIVDNVLQEAPYYTGQRIEFEESEVVDTIMDKMK